MATMKVIFDMEKERGQKEQWNVIHLLRDGNTYKASSLTPRPAACAARCSSARSSCGSACSMHI